MANQICLGILQAIRLLGLGCLLLIILWKLVEHWPPRRDWVFLAELLIKLPIGLGLVVWNGITGEKVYIPSRQDPPRQQ